LYLNCMHFKKNHVLSQLLQKRARAETKKPEVPVLEQEPDLIPEPCQREEIEMTLAVPAPETESPGEDVCQVAPAFKAGFDSWAASKPFGCAPETESSGEDVRQVAPAFKAGFDGWAFSKPFGTAPETETPGEDVRQVAPAFKASSYGWAASKPFGSAPETETPGEYVRQVAPAFKASSYGWAASKPFGSAPETESPGEDVRQVAPAFKAGFNGWAASKPFGSGSPSSSAFGSSSTCLSDRVVFNFVPEPIQVDPRKPPIEDEETLKLSLQERLDKYLAGRPLAECRKTIGRWFRHPLKKYADNLWASWEESKR
jgi:hypothetical protein